jgi:uncharacterized protein (TIGR03083 family)
MAETRTWTYEEHTEALAEELRALQALLASLTDEEWLRPTRCRWNPEHPWDVRALVSHINISIGMLPGFAANLVDAVPDRDRVSFFINEPRLVAPIVDEYAWKSVDQGPEALRRAFDEVVESTIAGAHNTPRTATSATFFGTMTLEEFLPTRTLEAVVHGNDVSDAVGRPPHVTPAAQAITVKLLEDLLARRALSFYPIFQREAGAKRPDELSDDLAFIQVATGRRPHPDQRFPILQ